MMKWLPKQRMKSRENDVESDFCSGDRQERPQGEGGEGDPRLLEQPQELPMGHNVVRSVAPADLEKQEWIERHNEVVNVRSEAPSGRQEQTDGVEGGDMRGKSEAPLDWRERTDGTEGKNSCGRSKAPLQGQEVTDAEGEERPCPQHVIVQEGTPATAPQVLGAVTAAATQLGVGCVLGYSGVTLTQQAILLNDFHAFLFGNVITLGAAVGSVATAGLQVRLGQRVTLMLALPVALVAWVTLAASLNVWVALAARMVQGLTLGFMAGPSNNYVVELSHSSLRGMLTATLNTSEQLGYLLVYAVGSWHLSWRQVALVYGLLTTVVPLMGFFFLPDSPRWLASRGRLQEAQKSLTFFRGSRCNSHIELSHITDHMKKTIFTTRDQMEEMEDSNILSKILLLALLLLASQFTGNFVVGGAGVSTFNSLEISMTPRLSVLHIGVIRVLGTLFYLLLVEHVGRKPLFLAAFLISAGSLAMLASFFYDRANSPDVTYQAWLPFASLATFSFFTNIGFSALSLLRQEILPTSVRSTAVALLFSLSYTGAFVASRTYLTIVASLGQHGAFWLYCFFNLLVAVVGGLTLPETRSRTLEEITSRYHKPALTPGHHGETTQTARNNDTTDTSTQPLRDHRKSAQSARDHCKPTTLARNHSKSAQPNHEHCKSVQLPRDHSKPAQRTHNHHQFTQHTLKRHKSIQPHRKFTQPSCNHSKSKLPARQHSKSSKPTYRHCRSVQPTPYQSQPTHDHHMSPQLTHINSNTIQPANDNYEIIQLVDDHRKITQAAYDNHDHGKSTSLAHDHFNSSQPAHDHGKSTVSG